MFLESPGLVNGYYNVWVEGSLSTAVPDLTSLYGLDQYDDGSAKFMGATLRDAGNKPVPIQTVRSTIENLAGPEVVPEKQGASAAFTWETRGYGEQFCYVDGKRVSNSDDSVHCTSPLNLKVTDDKKHTLEVVMLDVCGQKTANGLFFGTWGWKPNTESSAAAAAPVGTLSRQPAKRAGAQSAPSGSGR